jgi:SAM-dependent methyltransferase
VPEKRDYEQIRPVSWREPGKLPETRLSGVYGLAAAFCRPCQPLMQRFITLNDMPAYEIFGKFYDAVMGDRSEPAEHLCKLIQASRPNARNVLELGCGTGSMLKYMKQTYEVSGLDASSTMLSMARRKVPDAKLYGQNMVDFQIDDKFDVICCVFDSINHIRKLSEWKKVFAKARQHLSPGGCFIFDINTQRKLERHIAEPPWVHRFGSNLLIIDVTALPRGASNWNIKVFEHLNANRYVLHEEDIVEVSFPSRKIVAALLDHFGKVRVIDLHGNRPSTKSERLFFIATTG